MCPSCKSDPASVFQFQSVFLAYPGASLKWDKSVFCSISSHSSGPSPFVMMSQRAQIPLPGWWHRLGPGVASTLWDCLVLCLFFHLLPATVLVKLLQWWCRKEMWYKRGTISTSTLPHVTDGQLNCACNVIRAAAQWLFFSINIMYILLYNLNICFHPKKRNRVYIIGGDIVIIIPKINIKQNLNTHTLLFSIGNNCLQMAQVCSLDVRKRRVQLPTLQGNNNKGGF